MLHRDQSHVVEFLYLEDKQQIMLNVETKHNLAHVFIIGSYSSKMYL